MRAFVLATALAAASLSPSTPVLAQAARTQAPAAERPVALPEARVIIDRYIKAIGGRKAILAHSSVRATGTYSVPAQGISGSFERLSAKPNKVRLRVTLGGIGELVDAFDGTIGWTISPMTGPALVQGKELEEKVFDSDFYGELNDPARYDSIKTVEKTTFDGRLCYKISLVRKGGGEDFEFYDVATGLKAGGTGTRETPMGSITATQTRGDYKKFGDLLQPVTVREAAMGLEQVLTFATYDYDTVSPASFEAPANIKALIK